MQTNITSAGFSQPWEFYDHYCQHTDCGQADLEIIKPLEVLILTEDGAFSQTMGAILQDQGYQIYLAPDVETAVEELNNYNFDLLLVQLGQSDRTGLAAVYKARQLADPPKIMVIGGPRGTMFPVEAFEVEVDDYLIFPFSTTEFARRTAALLGPAARGWAQEQSPVNVQALDSLLLFMEEMRKALLQATAALQSLHRREFDHLSEDGAKILDEVMEHIIQAAGLACHFHQKTLHTSRMNG